jgi:hypothetical protein
MAEDWTRLPSKSITHFVAFGLAFLLFIQVFVLIGGLRQLRERRYDFRHLYAAGYMVRTGHGTEVYDYVQTKNFQDEVVGKIPENFPFNHLAFEALVFVPFSFLSCQVAYAAMGLLNVTVLVFTFRAIKSRMEPLKSVWTFLPIAAFLSFLPFGRTLLQGQDSIVLTALFLGAVLALDNQKNLLAGVLLALGLFKFQFVLPIAALLVAWKQWKAIAGFAIGSAVVVPLSIAVAGLSGLKLYFGQLLGMSAYLSSALQGTFLVRPDQMANFRGLFYGLTERSLGHMPAQILTLASSVILFWWVARQKPSALIAILFSALVSYHCLVHDLSIVAVPCLVISAKSAGRLLAVAATVFAAPSLATAFAIPFWLVSVPTLLLLFLAAGKSDFSFPAHGPDNDPHERRCAGASAVPASLCRRPRLRP